MPRDEFDELDPVELHPELGVEMFAARLLAPTTFGYRLVRSTDIDLPPEAIERLIGARGAPMAATISPLPLGEASSSVASTTDIDPRLPPAPTLSSAHLGSCIVSLDALSSVQLPEPMPADDVETWFADVCDTLTRSGWRHVAAPGVALDWQSAPSEIGRARGSSRRASGSIEGAANEGLSTHRVWMRSRLRPVRLVIDGACVSGSIHNGSQAVVLNVSRALALARPDAEVVLAVRPDSADVALAALGDTDVRVADRTSATSGFDVVYRPYQLIDPSEAAWLESAAERLVLGQLDMIAFSNPSYHPSPALFHSVRNLQRAMMRSADGVAFISDFGRATALAECPDLDAERLFTVSCGADPTPPPLPAPSERCREQVGDRPFIACTSATFWHKNRPHAIAVFTELCDRHGYEGSLVIAGPEPYYGRSTSAEDHLISVIDPSIGARIVRLGQVDEATKWWLLGAADLVLYPSVIEGFGLVPFEAAAVGTPSLSHAGSAVAEVLGEGPAVVTGWEPSDWALSAAAAIDGGPAAERILTQVGDAASRHTWDRAAQRTWNAIDQTLARTHASRFAEEGSVRSRVAGSGGALAVGSRSVHFTNRLLGVLQRRVESVAPRRSASADREAPS
jgi:glycosyltransferase involved in cell wall biosynthesis